VLVTKIAPRKTEKGGLADCLGGYGGDSSLGSDLDVVVSDPFGLDPGVGRLGPFSFKRKGIKEGE